MTWRQIQKTNFRSLKSLVEFLDLKLEDLGTSPRFPLNLPRRLANKIRKGDVTDPLLRQFVPLPEEGEEKLGFSSDPVEEASFCKSPKLLQKYQGRALILTTSACAMHCRFCFRQNFDYAQKGVLDKELDLIRESPSIHEVILSGGDPLSLGNQDLRTLFSELEEIPHVALIRFHSRFPLGIPERIDEEFLTLLANCSKQVVFALHANHPREYDSDVLKALKKLQCLGIPLLLQTVLLKGVNDSVEALEELFKLSASNGILPYYLHQLDRVQGAAHFEVEEEKGKVLIRALRSRLPGYAIPSYVREIPKEAHKTVLTS